MINKVSHCQKKLNSKAIRKEWLCKYYNAINLRYRVEKSCLA